MARASDSFNQPQGSRSRPRRWRKRIRNGIVAVAGLLLVAGFVLTRPSVLAKLLLPALARAVGGEATAARVALEGPETLVLEDLRIRANGWPGESGDVVRVDRMRVRFSLASLVLGDVRIASVDVDSLRLRLAERGDAPGEFSLLSLKPVATPPAKPGETPATRVAIEDLVIENGIAGDTTFEPLGVLRFRGSLEPVPGRSDAFAFQLEGRPDLDGRVAIGGLHGSFSSDNPAIDLAIEQLDLDGERIAVAPLSIRTWTSRLGLVGRIPSARFSYARGSDATVELDIEGVAMDLPIGALGGSALTDSWSGLVAGEQVAVKANPRMTLREGKLRFSKDKVALVGLKGDLGARDPRVIRVPFECDLALEVPRAKLPPFDWQTRDAWLENAVRIAPFSMRVAIRDFRSPDPKPGEPDVLQLPRAVAKVIADFRVTAWTLDVETSIERPAPAADGTPAPLTSRGELRLSRASGAYREFPYRLDEVDAVISFLNDDVTIDRFVGRCAGGAPVSIGGKLVGIAKGAEIDMRIQCADAPIDQRLFAAFEQGPRAALSLLFDARASEGLAAANLLPDAALLVDQRRDLARLGADPANSSDAARLERSIEAGPFALGGRAGFDLRIYSPQGFGQPVIVTGDIRVRDAGAVFGRFPYPLRIKSGSFTLLDEAIVIGGGGLRAITPAGGVFVVSGSVQIPRDGQGGRDLRPLISITDTDDAVNPALLAAIPFEDDPPPEWPGRRLAPAGELLNALGLRGAIELNGFVSTKPDGSDAFDVRLDFSRGRAEPDEPGRAWLAAQGLPWPPGFVLEDCTARVDITPERVSFDDCRGRRGSGAVEARGFAELDGPGRLVELRLDNLPIDRAFEGFLDEDPGRARERFARLRPSGALDGTVTRTVNANEAVTRGSLVPKSIEVTMDGLRVRADHLAGRLDVDGSTVRADSLELRLSREGAEDGILRLSGELSMKTLDAQLTNGRIESPVLREILSDRSAGIVALLRAREAKGLYDARYSATRGERLEVRPKTLSIGGEGQRVSLEFDDVSRIDADAAQVRFDLRGALGEGARGTLNVRGTCDIGPEYRLAAALDVDAEALTPALRATLPPPLDTSATAINLTSAGRFRLNLGEIDLRWLASRNAEDPERYALRGESRIEGALFDAGVAFTEVGASIPIAFQYAPRSAKPVDFRSAISFTGGRAMGRAFGRSFAGIASTEDGRALAIDAAGDVADGRFDVQSRLDFDRDRYRAQVRVAEADFEALRAPDRPPPSEGGGRFTARLEVGGPMGGTPTDVAARTGSIDVKLRDATFASTPIALRALQISQLMPPVSSALHGTDATMTISGNTATIDSVRLSSGTLQLSGTGTMDLPTFAVAMRLYAKGTLPVISELIGGITGAIFAIDVVGTLGDPKVSIAPLPAITEQPAVRVPLPEASPPAPDPEAGESAPAEPSPAANPANRRDSARESSRK